MLENTKRQIGLLCSHVTNANETTMQNGSRQFANQYSDTDHRTLIILWTGFGTWLLSSRKFAKEMSFLE